MKKAALYTLLLVPIVALAEWVTLARFPMDPWRLAAVLGPLALVLSVFIGLAHHNFTRLLRHWAASSPWVALATPLLLFVPYLIYALGTGCFNLRAAGRLVAYLLIPPALLLPDRLRHNETIGWRDVLAMLALAVPVSGHWLEGIWSWPQELYFFRPLYSVCLGAYCFIAIRHLEGVGYKLGMRKQDLIHGLANFAGFTLLGIPLGLALGFIHPHTSPVSPAQFVSVLLGIYLTIAIPEELLFRGILQNFLIKSFTGPRKVAGGIGLASVIFGASHLHHPPVPNWKYGILAALAGVFYGNAFRTRGRLSAAALTHSLVDTLWHFWF